MSLDIGAALSDGFDRTLKRNALILMGVFLVIGLLSTVLSQTMNAGLVGQLAGPGGPTGGNLPPGFPGAGGAGTYPFGLPVPWPVAAVGSLIVAILAEVVRIVAVRTLVSDATDEIPGEYLRRNIGLATINSFVGNLVASILIVIGLIFFIVPGIFLALSFFFVRQEIAVEDKNFIDALADSWSLTSGNRIELLGLAIILAVIGFVVGSPSLVFFFLSPVAGAVVSQIIGSITTVFSIAVAARAYDQLRSERNASLSAGTGADDFSDPL
ncbi:MAG: hypothetical protein ABEJ23_04910 [Haloarculaceae archaeon]